MTAKTETALSPEAIKAKRARARRLSAKLAQHSENAAARAALWRELRAAGVSVQILAADSGLTDPAVRQVLNRPE